MPVWLELFLVFLQISMFSFGGGYVAFPIIIEANAKYGWLTESVLSNSLALAGMAPGPVAFNAAVAVGYQTAGVLGMVVALVGIALPCAIIVITVATFFFKINHYPSIQAILRYLRATVTGVIFYAAVRYAVNNQMFGISFKETFDFNIDVTSIVLIGITLLLLLKTKIHPIWLIFGGAGITLIL